MSRCKNEEMNLAGTGKQNSYPKSCGTCGFSVKCARGVERDPASTIEERYYVGGKRSVDKYAVIYTDTIHHEGDERSRTHPGHGYPAYTETVQKIQTFNTEAELKAWILKNDSGYGRKNFTAIKYNELRVSTEVKVELN